MNPPRITIIGLGLIGGSIAASIRNSYPETKIVAWDPNVESLDFAFIKGIIHSIAMNAADAVKAVDIVFIAAPVDQTLHILSQIENDICPEAIVTDVSSTKNRIVLNAPGKLSSNFIGGHPMAGSEHRGVANFKSDMFSGANWILTPTSRSSNEKVQRLTDFISGLGAVVRICSPEEHDKMVAIVSHLPHLVAYCLSTLADDGLESNWKDIAAGSFRDGTRVANSSPDLWTKIISDNRDNILPQIELLKVWFSEVEFALKQGDTKRVADIISKAYNGKQNFL